MGIHWVNIRVVLDRYWDNGKLHYGKYYLGFRVSLGWKVCECLPSVVCRSGEHLSTAPASHG